MLDDLRFLFSDPFFCFHFSYTLGLTRWKFLFRKKRSKLKNNADNSRRKLRISKDEKSNTKMTKWTKDTILWLWVNLEKRNDQIQGSEVPTPFFYHKILPCIFPFWRQKQKLTIVHYKEIDFCLIKKCMSYRIFYFGI